MQNFLATVTAPVIDAARADYVQARDQYRAALNAAAALTSAGPNTRARMVGALDRAAVQHSAATLALDIVTGGQIHVSDPRD